MRFLVTGTGRCGTLYAARYLQALGLDVKHEALGRDGTCNWALGVPWDLGTQPSWRVLHIVREPLATISSLTACLPDHEIWKHIISNSPVSHQDPLLLRAMKHWLYWNLACEAVADESWRIEDWNIDTVRQFFGVDGQEPDIPKNTHTWKGKFMAFGWRDLNRMEPDLTRVIRKLATRYGYQCAPS